jgi:hypothetical protein
MPINQMYRTWIQRICELRPEQRITQVRNFVWLMVGIFHSRSVHLSKIAGKVPGQAQNLSTVRRLSRFLDNPIIRVRDWYEPIARQWLKAQLDWVGEIRLIVDGTKVGFGHQLLMVSLAYRHRAIPIAWTWVKQVRGHSSTRQQLALLKYVKGLVSIKAAVFWLATVNSAPFWFYGSLISGVGSMLYVKNHEPVCGSTNKLDGKSWAVLFRRLVRVSG